MSKLNKIGDSIIEIKNDIEKLLYQIDNLEVKIIQQNNTNSETIELYKLMMEKLILEHHTACKKIFS